MTSSRLIAGAIASSIAMGSAHAMAVPAPETSPLAAKPAISAAARQQIRDKIAKYDADLKMSRAEAELAKLSQDFNFDVTTDFGQIEQVIQEKISLNRAKVRVAADLSGEGIVDIQREQAMQKVMADQALREFEIQAGLVSPETAKVSEAQKELGPAQPAKEVLKGS